MKAILNFFIFGAMLAMFAVWGTWVVAPHLTLEFYQISTETITGINALKSDMGGALLAIGLFILLYFIKGSKWLYPAGVLTGAVLFSRLISLAVDGFSPEAIAVTVLEILAIGSFYAVIKYYPSKR